MSRRPPRFSLTTIVALLIIAGILVTIVLVPPGYRTAELMIGLLIVLGVSALMVLLFGIAAGFADLKLADKRHAFGLPDGSIRALIALLLIMIWVSMSIYVFSVVANPPADSTPETTRDVLGLAQQLITTMGTLVVAVAGFYFGTTSVAAARKAVGSSAPPVIRYVTPDQGALGTKDLSLTVYGKNFLSVTAVRLVKGIQQVAATNVLSSDSEIQCKITIHEQQHVGKWALIVETAHGGQDQFVDAFEITSAPARSQPV